jgi:RNA polymerase sigma-70 factor (ECF subfamily)
MGMQLIRSPLPPAQAIHVRPPVPGLAQIYAEHCDFVWRNLRRMGVQEASIDDAVQEVFLVVHRRLADFEARSQVKTWLFWIVLRVAQTQRRNLRRRNAHLPDVPTFDLEAVANIEQESPLELVARREAVTLLHQLLATLDDDKRAMLVLVELEQMSVPEAAEALGINLNTAYSRLRMARNAFEEAIVRHRAREGRGGRDSR